MRGVVLFFICMSACMSASFISGTVSGLGSGKSLVIKSGVTTKVVTSNGPYQVTNNGPLTIGIQPSGQVCKINITDIVCANAYTVGGTIFGAPSSFVLRLNSSTLLVSTNATSYKFSTLLLPTTPYLVSVGIQPSNFKCTISNASGVIQNSNITNANITCVPFVSATVTWTLPTYNTDGTLLTDLTSYILYYGTDPTLTTYATRLIPASTLTTTVTNLIPGNTYYFSIASVSASGGVGPRSNFASVTK